MAAAPSLGGQPPAGLAGELAPVIPLDPSRAEEGFSHGEAIYRDLLAADPLSLVGGLWRGINQVRSRVLGDALLHSNPVPRRVILPYNGHDHLFLVTDPDPETGVNTDEATNSLFELGLGQLPEVGSALRLHIAYAQQHPDQRVISEATKGMSHTGKTVSAADLSQRRIDAMAGESLRLVRYLTKDGKTNVKGTSRGARSAVSMTEQNLAADHKDQLDITELALIASAAIATEVDNSENFRDPDIDEAAYREDLSTRFKKHIPEDLLRMLVTHTRDVLECWPDIAAYLLAPHKLPDRVRTIAADYGNVKEGETWSVMKHVVSQTNVLFLGGSRDPLVQEQIPQLDMLDRLYPGQIRRRIVDGMGHLMTAAAQETVGHLDEMELAVAA